MAGGQVMPAVAAAGEGTVGISAAVVSGSVDATPSALPLLTRAIMEVPLPGAPPYAQQLGAEIGLAFVDGALRQNHIRRVSESLQLIEHGAALQTVRVDLSLSLLNEGQRRAGATYSRLRGMKHGPARAARQAPAEPQLLWVPVTRLSRRSVSPVEVLDAHGNLVPRLTQDETGQLMAPAMYRLLRSILASDPEASKQGSLLHRLLQRDDAARWVIQRALVALTTERAHPQAAAPSALPAGVSNDDLPPRRLAAAVLRKKSDVLDEYLRLLHIVINHYFVIVALSTAEEEHTLTYRSPLEASDSQPRALRQRISQGWRLLGNAGNAYDVEYQSRLSTGVRSYHFAAETEADLSIHPPYLTTDFDRARTDRLSDDLRFLAAASTEDHSAGFQLLLESELATALGRLAEVIRRRSWEAEQIGLELQPNTAPTCQRLRDHVMNGGLLDDSALPADLAVAADELVEFDLGSDLSAERDPPSSHGHAYWRKPLESLSSSLTTINVRCNFRITDTADGGPRYVGVFVGAVAVMNVLIACLLFGRLRPFGIGPGPSWSDGESHDEVAQNADALVAVLLLVPGFLYTRLRLPVPGTIAGRLRTFTRVLSYAVILSSAAIAVLVAAGAAPRTIELATWASIVIDLVCYWLLQKDRHERVPLPVPRWARADGTAQGGEHPVDVRFTGVGSPDDL
jgi:hypothetical protein